MTSIQVFLPIEDISSDLIFLKDGSVSLVINTSAVNFNLLFETEQISIIQSFAGLLNSLSFPIQIIIHSRRLDVSSYLETLKGAIKTQTNPRLAQMTVSYLNFVASIIKENNVLDKQFYITLSVSPIELGVLPQNLTERGKKAQVVLTPRKDHLIRQLFRLGLKARQLNSIELVKLFYSIYNPTNNHFISPQVAPNQVMPKTQPPTIIPAHPQPPHAPPISTTAPMPTSLLPNPPLPTVGSVSYLAPPFVVEELADG